MDERVDKDDWTPMSPERRAALIEELVAWSTDPNGWDWDAVEAMNPTAPLGFVP